MELNRSDTILKYIVEYFIKTAQPVGSKTLIDEYKLPFSSATIRNEMFALEKMGYIEKTHTSSGRVPSSLGYKYYCDNLRDGALDEKIKYSLQQVLESKTRSIEETIRESCEIISHMTSLVSVVLGPNDRLEKLANIQLIRVNDDTLTAIFVTDTGYVENKTFFVSKTIDVQDIIKCVELLNNRLIGTPINDLVEKMEALRPILSEHIINHDVIYQALLQTFLKFAADRLKLYGEDELFKHPEFVNDIDKLRKVIKLLEKPETFKEAEEDLDKDDDGISIKIGEVDGGTEISMVTAKVKIGKEGENTIALVGPTRMDYDKALAALEYLIHSLNEYFKK
jgi:heat-inducible transcriptional repressor